MTANKKRGSGVERRQKGQSPNRDEAPLGALLARILKKLQQLDKEAFAYRVLGDLMIERARQPNAIRIDASQVYTSIYKLIDRGFVEPAGVRTDRRGPPQKLYRVTPAGETALEETIEYHQKLLGVLMGEQQDEGGHPEKKGSGPWRVRNGSTKKTS